MEPLDPRLGHAVDGKPVFPAVDVFGNAYLRNGCSTLHLEADFFVVLPTFQTASTDSRLPAAVAELKALIAPGAPPTASQKGK